MKKVLIFSLAYFPWIGGAEVAIKETTDRLPDLAFDLITYKFEAKAKDYEKIGQVNVYRLGNGGRWGKYFFPLTAFWFAQKLQRKNNYDSCWGMMANQAGLAALLFKFNFSKIKFVLTLQEGDSEREIRKRTWFLLGLYGEIYRRAEVITVLSEYLARRAKKYSQRAKILLIPNGVDKKFYRENISQAAVEKIKNDLQIAPNEKVIISVSRLVEKNGLADLIKSVKFLDFPVKLILAGGGKLAEELKFLAVQEKVANQVLFVGEINNDELPKYLATADVFCRPSLSEGLGSAFLESMAAQTPVVATPVGGIPDFLQDGQTGLFCQVGNPSDVAEKINRLISEEKLRQQIINNSYQLVKEQYDWRLIAEQFKFLF